MNQQLQLCDQIGLSSSTLSQRRRRYRQSQISLEKNATYFIPFLSLRNGVAENTFAVFQRIPDIIAIIFCFLIVGFFIPLVESSLANDEVVMDNEIFAKFETARQRYQEAMESSMKSR